MTNYKEEQYTRVYRWMAEELKIDKTTLLIYALIFGFTQNSEEWFRGSREYMAEFCGVSVQTIDNNIAKLLKKNLIIRGSKTKLGIVQYKCNPKFALNHMSRITYNESEHVHQHTTLNIEEFIHDKKPLRTY